MKLKFTYVDKGPTGCEHIRFRLVKNGSPTNLYLTTSIDELKNFSQDLNNEAEKTALLLLYLAARDSYVDGMTLVQLKNAIEAREFTL